MERKTENGKLKTENGNPISRSEVMQKRLRGDNISERLIALGARVVRVAGAMPSRVSARHIAEQLVRSGTSPGAHYEEARGAESKRDFIHKLGVALKELQETRYWLCLIARAGLIAKSRLDPLVRETDELCRIIGQSILTTRSRSR